MAEASLMTVVARARMTDLKDTILSVLDVVWLWECGCDCPVARVRRKQDRVFCFRVVDGEETETGGSAGGMGDFISRGGRNIERPSIPWALGVHPKAKRTSRSIHWSFSS